MNRGLIRALKRAFAAAADAERAASQQAYMKSAMPYYGIAAPELRAICRRVFADHPLNDPESWTATFLDLWRKARYREERYAAVELAGYKRYRDFLTADRIGILEELIVTGAWWDHVDPIAINFVGRLLAEHPDRIVPILRAWSTGDDLWLRRGAILAQLKFKTRTDADLLFELIEPSIESREFFLRKAIGWALREYSKTDPDTVIGYVSSNRDRLSGLSKREGLRVLVKQGVIGADEARV
jgi:3-methyladenine DNA glycosylase AlkD